MMKARARGPYRRSKRTREVILRAACQLFAERGFLAVGMRDIAKRAGVALQVPHYHFDSKDGLFAECVKFTLMEVIDMRSLFPSLPRFESHANALEQVGARIRICFRAFRPSGENNWIGGIMFHAMIDDRDPAFEMFWQAMSIPRSWFFAALTYLRPDWTPEQMSRWHGLLWAQISFYTAARRAILRATNKTHFDAAMIESAADHLAQVMLTQILLRTDSPPPVQTPP